MVAANWRCTAKNSVHMHGHLHVAHVHSKHVHAHVYKHTAHDAHVAHVHSTHDNALACRTTAVGALDFLLAVRFRQREPAR